MIYEMTVSQFLPFNEPGAGSSITGEIVSQTLLITETIKASKMSRVFQQRMNIGQTIIKRTSIKNLTVRQTLAMWGRPSHGPSRTVTQIFSMWQNARTVKYQIVKQTFNVIQNISNYKFHGVYQSLVLTQTITRTVRRHVTLAQTFHMLNSENAYVSGEDPCHVAHPYTLGGPNGSPSYVF